MTFAEVVEKCMRLDASLRGIPVEENALLDLKRLLGEWRAERSRLRTLSTRATGTVRSLGMVAFHMEEPAAFSGSGLDLVELISAGRVVSSATGGAGDSSIRQMVARAGFTPQSLLYCCGTEGLLLLPSSATQQFCSQIEEHLSAALGGASVCCVRETLFPHELLFGREAGLKPREAPSIFDERVWQKHSRAEPVAFGEIAAAMLEHAKSMCREADSRNCLPPYVPALLERCEACGQGLGVHKSLCAACSAMAIHAAAVRDDPQVQALLELRGALACARLEVFGFRDMLRRQQTADEFCKTVNGTEDAFTAALRDAAREIGAPVVAAQKTAATMLVAFPSAELASCVETLAERSAALLQQRLGRPLRVAVGAACGGGGHLAAGYLAQRAAARAGRACAHIQRLSAAGRLEGAVDYERLDSGSLLNFAQKHGAAIGEFTLKPYGFSDFREMARRARLITQELAPGVVRSLARRLRDGCAAEVELEVCSLLCHSQQARACFEKMMSSRDLEILPSAILWKTERGYATALFDMLELSGNLIQEGPS